MSLFERGTNFWGWWESANATPFGRWSEKGVLLAGWGGVGAVSCAGCVVRVCVVRCYRRGKEGEGRDSAGEDGSGSG